MVADAAQYDPQPPDTRIVNSRAECSAFCAPKEQWKSVPHSNHSELRSDADYTSLGPQASNSKRGSPPSTWIFEVATANPTALRGRVEQICSLGANIIGIQETKLNEWGQRRITPHIKALGYRPVWGKPAATAANFKSKTRRNGAGPWGVCSGGVALLIKDDLPVREVKLEGHRQPL